MLKGRKRIIANHARHPRLRGHDGLDSGTQLPQTGSQSAR